MNRRTWFAALVGTVVGIFAKRNEARVSATSYREKWSSPIVARTSNLYTPDELLAYLRKTQTNCEVLDSYEHGRIVETFAPQTLVVRQFCINPVELIFHKPLTGDTSEFLVRTEWTYPRLPSGIVAHTSQLRSVSKSVN